MIIGGRASGVTLRNLQHLDDYRSLADRDEVLLREIDCVMASQSHHEAMARLNAYRDAFLWRSGREKQGYNP